MNVFAYSSFVAVMALVAVGLALVALVVRFAVAPDSRRGLADAARWLAWLVAAASMAGSLVFSQVYDFEPCLLCWYQRIAMYPLALVLLVAAIRRDAAARLYGLPLSIIGLGISVWHILVQNVSALQGSGSCDPAVPCSFKYVDRFDFISIPVMAAAGFLLISVLLAFFSTTTNPVSEKQ